MSDSFSPKYIRNLKARSPSGHLISITIFSEYRPEEVEKKTKAIWAINKLRLNEDNEVINFLDGRTTFFHPKTNEEYTVIYD
ncbi:hypothetical protein ACG94V_05630 [Acinetobacter sp. ULE_I001]|uniref:hypothetical protein n=1 Tax=Acinetobacter TaxID=469 RepID=UPI003AF50696